MPPTGVTNPHDGVIATSPLTAPEAARTIVDMRIGGEVKNFFWSFTVQNVFDDEYYDYAIASPFTPGRYAAYPQPGRTFLLRAGAQF